MKFLGLVITSLFALGVFADEVAEVVEKTTIGDNEDISTDTLGDKIIPNVETIDGQITTVYYTIIDEQTIVDDDDTSSAGSDEDWDAYPNVAKGMKDVNAFEALLARIMAENPEYDQLLDSQASQAQEDQSSVTSA